MIEITGNKGNTIYYSCSCGTNGRCLIRPLGEGNTIVVDVKCAMCRSAERVCLTQEAEADVINSVMAWSLVLTNDIVNEN